MDSSEKTNDTSLFFFKEILQKHFVFIVSSLAFSIGFIVMMSYTRNFPSNIFAELSTADLLYIFGGGMVLTLLLAIMPIIPYIPLIQKNAPNSEPQSEQTSGVRGYFTNVSLKLETLRKLLKNLECGEKIFVSTSFLVFYLLLYFLFAPLIIASLITSPISFFFNDNVIKIISWSLAVIFIFLLFNMPITLKGLIFRSISVVVFFIFLAGVGASNVAVRLSGLGNKPACIILSPESNMIVRGFTSITTENHQNMFFTKRPLLLVLQTKEHLYLQERQDRQDIKSKVIFQLRTTDNLLFSPTGGNNTFSMPNYNPGGAPQ